MKTRGKEDDGEADPQKRNGRLCLLLFRWSFSKLTVASCLLFTVNCTVCRNQGGLLLVCWHLIATWHPHPYPSPYIWFLCLSVFLSCCSPLCLLYKTHGHHAHRAVSAGSSCTRTVANKSVLSNAFKFAKTVSIFISFEQCWIYYRI